MPKWTRTENGQTVTVSARVALDEINAAQMHNKGAVREMSYANHNAHIVYKDGRDVRLTRQEESAPAKNLVNFRGGKVHTQVMIGKHAFPECKPGMGSVFDWTETESPITCRTCLMYERRRNETTN